MSNADLVLTNAAVHPMTGREEPAAALACRDGEVTAVGSSTSVKSRAGPETIRVDCDGGVVLPGFVDAHTHLESTGKHLVHADLSRAGSREEAVEILRAEAAPHTEWVLGFGYDESDWPDGRYLTRADLDGVSESRPVAAIRVDMHTASLNAVALERLADESPAGDVRRAGGEPTGVVVEDAVEALRSAIAPDRDGTRRLVAAARDRAHERGVTAVHDMVRNSHAPRVYRDMAAAGELALRVRLNYWSDHLEAVRETGLRPNAGGEFVQVGAIKTFTDGSIGARTARVSEPYADAEAPDERGEWVVEPDELRSLVETADDEGLQLAVHAIGDEAIEETVAALEACADSAASRHRIEHVELASDEHLERMAEAGVVASCQPNFLRWARPEGLYDSRLGERRSRASNRFRRVLDAGVTLAFGSDSMPLDPLTGVHHAVNAPAPAQRLTVTEALRAYTRGAAKAGFDEERLGTLAHGTPADLVVLGESPWKRPGAIEDIPVKLTAVGGEVVHER